MEPNGNDDLETPAQEHQWLDGIVDDQLRWELTRKVSGEDLSEIIRSAFILVERRIRQTAGLADHEFGKELIDKAFAPGRGLLQPVSPVEAECAGLYHLLLGLFLYYRNPVAHRTMEYTKQSAQKIVALIDHALQLVDEAARAGFTLSSFVGPHEGRILHRHDFLVDIDADGEMERVVLLGMGPATDDGQICHHLSCVILKKGGDSYNRIPAESIQGASLHRLGWVESRHVTSVEKPDVLVYWTLGESSSIMVILREQDRKYVIVNREIVEGKPDPYFGPLSYGFTRHPYRQVLRLADIDGDGVDEVIQTLHFDPEEMAMAGYPDIHVANEERIDVCRVFKWNGQKNLMEQVDERLIVGSWDKNEHEVEEV